MGRTLTMGRPQPPWTTEPKTLFQSGPTSSRAASEGLGGGAGGAVVAGVVLVAALGLGVLLKTESEVVPTAELDSLSKIVAQLASGR